jgi:hypothetical protein
MNNNTILAIVFLMAGTLLTTTAVTIVPAAHAEGDDHKDKNGDDHKDKRGDDHDKDKNGDGNKNLAKDGSAAAIADCDKNDVDRSEFNCFGIAVNDVEVDLGRILAGMVN